jgi:hypothetical protein
LPLTACTASAVFQDFRLELADDADGVEHVGGVALGELEVDDAAAEAGGDTGGAGQGGEKDRVVTADALGRLEDVGGRKRQRQPAIARQIVIQNGYGEPSDSCASEEYAVADAWCEWGPTRGASTKGAWPFQPDALWVSLQKNDIRGTITATLLHDVKLHALSLG